MYIKSIILDGFKSYGQRTEINGFDKQFNAITGLNGSGKSNILDSICFVLGISNLSQVRATSLQDLIFRSGQAGVNKATVSITFDNSDPDQSPPGFHDVSEITVTRQIVLGGKNKYFINGSTVVAKKIEDFFCSCQLNVNNPHFLIMQGKITKVLNMKPLDILAMIEEAAGTKMYETKKQIVQKTIDKKDAKFQELNTIYHEEIGPKLEKLRKERAAYMEYKSLSRELEHILNLYRAWQFIVSQRTLDDNEKLLKDNENKILQLKEKITKNKQTINTIDEELKNKTKNAKNSDNERLQKLEDDLQENEKLEAQANAAVKSAKDNLASEEKKKLQLEEAIKNDNKELKSKQTELEKMKAQFNKFQQNDTIDNEAYEAAVKRFEALSLGMEINDDGEAATLQEQLMNIKEKLTSASTEKQVSQMELKHCQEQLKQKQQFGSNENDYKSDEINLKKIEEEIGNIEKSLKKINYSEERMNELHTNKQKIIQEIRNLKSIVENFQARRPYTSFRYRDPETNFNRNRVKGVACRLFTVKDPIANLALETAGGGRLFNVIVDTEVTGKKLLQHGNLQQRTTFIPLNKIDAHRISDNVIRYAQDLVGVDNVKPALAYLNYHKNLEKAMEYIFGNVFICKDINIAKQIAFHPRILRKCVTLDGDTVDPAGTLSGGAPPKGDPILKQIHDIIQYEEQLKSNEKELEVIENEIQSMINVQQRYLTIKESLTMKKHEMNLITKRLQNTTHYRQQEEINNLKTRIGEYKTKIEQSSMIIEESNKKIHELEKKIRNSTNSRDGQLKQAELEMNKLKQKAINSRNQWKEKEVNLITINLEIKEIEKSLDDNRAQIATIDGLIEKLGVDYEETVAELKKIQGIVKIKQEEVDNEKAVILEKNKDLQRRLHEKDKLNNEIVEYELQIKKQGYDIKKMQDDIKKLKSKHDDYAKKIDKNSPYLKEAKNLSNRESSELEAKIRRCQETVHKLQRTVNEKAQTMLEQQEAECNELKRKHRIVETDKQKIVQAIADLDHTKEEALKIAFDQISKDFGSIFSTLLPGANAKLVTLPNRPISSGLEIKVSLGGIWKDNLTELSGGQRSLAALSLILAMLLFKPAPLYILDEVDAALDLSHTQNIGSMLRTHFKKSQFIIVSLKDGMFNNANVLFKTQFIDGVSTITRTVNKND